MSSLRLCLVKIFCIYGSILSFPIFANPIAESSAIVSVVNRSGAVGTGIFVSPQVIATALHNIDDFNKPVKDNIFLIHSETREQINISSIRNIDFKHDIILLNVGGSKSYSYYDLNSLESPTPSKSKRFYERSYVVGMLNGKLVKLNGSEPLPYSQENEDALLQRITYMSPNRIQGLSGSPIFAENGKILGIVNSQERRVSIIFTQIQAVQRMLEQSSTTIYDNVKKAIEDTVDFSDKVVQFRVGWQELNRASLYKPNMSEREKQEIRNSQVGLAVHWFKRSAAQGYSPAMLELANIHAYGMGVFEVDVGQFRPLAEQSAKKGFAPAQHRLGIFLTHVKDHFHIAVSWLKSAAEQGYFGDIAFLPLLSTEGIPFKEIIKALDTLSESGHPQARAYLSHYLFTGQGVAQNIKRAKKLLNQAVDDRYPLAIRQLSLLYQEGKYGYPIDDTMALKLRRQAEQLLEYSSVESNRSTTNDNMSNTRPFFATGVVEACRGFIARSLRFK